MNNSFILQKSIDPSPDDFTWKTIVWFRYLFIVIVDSIKDVSSIDIPQIYCIIDIFELVHILFIA